MSWSTQIIAATMTELPDTRAWTDPTRQLVLDLKSTWGSRAMISPRLRINGQPAPVTWGVTRSSGQLRVEVTCTYLWSYGRAVDTVPVSPNSRVEVHHSAPYSSVVEPQARSLTQRTISGRSSSRMVEV